MSTPLRAPHPSRGRDARPRPLPPAVPSRRDQERRAGDAVCRALARWSGDVAVHESVPGDK